MQEKDCNWILVLKKDPRGTDISPRFYIAELTKAGLIAGSLIRLYGWVQGIFGRKRLMVNTLPAIDALKIGVGMAPDLYGRLTDGNSKYIAQSSHLNSVALVLGGGSL